jgi:hypothetical protein
MRRARLRISCLSSPASGRKHGHRRSRAHRHHILQRLRRHLPQAVPGDDRQGMIFARKALGDAQHHSPIKQQSVLLGVLCAQSPAGWVQTAPGAASPSAGTAPAFHQRACHVHRRLPRPRPATPKMHETQMRPAAHHLIGRHRRIESSRQADRPFAQRYSQASPPTPGILRA